MTNYMATNSNFNLSSKQQQNLAEGINEVNNIVTEADNYFANIKFILVFYFYFKLLR